VALTATATPAVREDILRVLGIPQASVFIRGFDRANLVLEVVAVSGRKEKELLLPDLVRPGPTLVYAATRNNVERAAQALEAAGVRVGSYHAGLPAERRTEVQEAFLGGRLPVVVATNAFGMGIDKPDIRAIIHVDMPGSVEAYYQEIGRAGRDGRTSRAVLLHHDADREIHRFFIDGSHPPADWVHRMWDHLCSAGRNPVFAALASLAECLPDEGGERAAGATIHTLVREGRVRRIHPTDRSATLVRLAMAAPVLGGLRARVWRRLAEAAERAGDRVDFQPDDWAAELDVDRDALVAALRALDATGAVRWVAAERIGGVELIESERPLVIDEARIRELRAREYDRLARMEAYVSAPCRRRFLVSYFGETPAWPRCGTCDGCRAGRPIDEVRTLGPDEETAVLQVLSCVARMTRARRGPAWGVDLVAKVLVGSTEQKVRTWGFAELSTYGLMKAWTSGEVTELIEHVAAAGLLDARHVSRSVGGREVTYKEVALTDEGWAALTAERGTLALAFPLAAGQRLRRARPAPKKPTAPRIRTADGLLGALRDVRTRLAASREVPAYVVASNDSLAEMARLRPTSRNELLAVRGMGPTRVQLYGEAFLTAIRADEGR
jgi:ATP-dependent DNA helicase RecQ